MKAARFYGERDIRIDEDIDPGDIGPTDVRIDVDACGICGTDLHEYERAELTPETDLPETGASRPIVVGHEFSGHVSEVGDDVTRLEIGDPVTVHPNIPCHDCVYCADGAYNRCEDTLAIGLETGTGGFAESTVVPAQQVHVLPESVDVWEGALVEPLAVGLHAVRRSGMQAGDTVAVFGCGPIGLTALRAAEAGGAKRIFVSEPNKHRREIARRLGADVAIDPLEKDAVERITDATDDGVDIAFEFAGVEPSVDAAIRSTRRGGAVTIGSLSEGTVALDLDEIVLNERELRGTFCYGFPPRSFRSEFDAIIQSLVDGEIDTDAFATKRISLDDIVEEGYEELADPDTEHVKILVEP